MQRWPDDIFVEAAKRAAASVVTVSTVKLFELSPVTAAPVRGVGSGVIMDAEGNIVTNYHVVENAEQVDVILHDRGVRRGRIVGRDSAADIAVIKVSAGGLTPMPLGDSDRLNPGQLVLAMGNPLGLAGGPTVSLGIISGLNRTIVTETGIMENLIQTDAAINPGNSGGPLIDLEGNAVGIATAVVPAAQGIGFAIPVNTVREVYGEIVSYGRVVRPWLGIYGFSVTPEVAAHYGLPVDRGVVVADVAPSSPAELAGLERGDIIVSSNGRQVSTIEELKASVQNQRAGESTELEFYRGGRLFRTFARLAAQ